MGYRLLDHLPDGCEVKYQALLYSRPAFLQSNNDLPQLHYYWVDMGSKSAMAHIAFNLEESEAISPVKAPFGGIEYSGELKHEELCTFIIFIQRELQENGIKFLRFDQPPDNYQNQELLEQILGELNFKAKKERVYHGIPVLDENLVDKMALMEQRRLRKCLKQNFQFKALGPTKLAEVFQAITRWREIANKPLSMSWEELSNTRKLNPDVYLPFGVYEDQKLIAATITIRASDSALYHFYPAHDPEYNNFSPMVLLVNGLYDWCKANRFGLLDLGTSYLNDKMNKSLVRFKSHIGGVESRARSYRKTLSSR